jgi:hypothetical protein
MKLQGHILDDVLACELVDLGAAAGRVAVAHTVEPGATRRLFAFEAYLRSVELARPVLEAHGYTTRHVGSALIGSKDGHELQFATAGGLDITMLGDFDPLTSKLRKRAAALNAGLRMDALPGLPEPPIAAVIHLVWSFTRAEGLVAAHVGMLLPSGRDGMVRWLGLTRLPYGPAAAVPAAPPVLPGYRNQASSDIVLARRPQTRSDAS